MVADWRSDWLWRIICALALWGFGIVCGGLLLFGVLAQVQGAPLGAGPVLAIVAGSVGLVAWVVLCRMSTRPTFG